MRSACSFTSSIFARNASASAACTRMTGKGAGAPMSLRHTFSELRRQKVPPAAVKKLLESMQH